MTSADEGQRLLSPSIEKHQLKHLDGGEGGTRGRTTVLKGGQTAAEGIL